MTSMTHPAGLRAARLRALWRSIAERARACAHEIAGIWRYARAREEFNRLPDSILRDLAVHRSEFDSYFAEDRRLAPRTRRRIADAIERRTGW